MKQSKKPTATADPVPKGGAEQAPSAEAPSAETGEHKNKGRFGGVLPEVIRRALNQGAEALNNEQLRETVVAEVVRRAVAVGSEVVDSTEDRLRKLGEDLPLPKETINTLTGKLDDYKDELFKMVSDEVRDFLDQMDLVDALQKVLTSVSFEISTEIRFVPNEKAAKGEGGAPVKPDVKASVKMKRRKGRKDKE